MICPACASDNDPGRKFCGECGASLAPTCPACGTANAPGVKFCGECGAALAAQPREPTTPAPHPAAERRLVSVLFADLVGFTTASERRDAEETRELLSRYFDVARTLIERYGGTVEKFIGDAVMAVWGAPVAQEDDAERAVRAALDLVAAVPELDSALKARAGVLTGEAAVTLGAEGQGMVAGDLVNTASRIQSLAEPGAVLVGEVTRRASDAAIAYAEAGSHELRGKAEAVPLWRALRVTAARGGALKAAGLEPPFVGRERELRLVKELFHASAEEGKAHLVSVLGIGGIGKSRLAWEFYKYVDGLAEPVRWHRGRCLAYGEGVTYWALAEMVRMRAEIIEGEAPASARAKLRATVETFVPDPGELEWVEPRLAHLLALEDGQARERDDLFAGWRLFFERIAEAQATVLVFEDMQWADAAMLEFVAYLLEWSRRHPIFVLALARPELAERHPDLAAAGRNVTTLSLEPLSSEAMERLLAGLVPGLPAELRDEILARAEGVPLYAVETVRMLLDRGLLAREGDEYRPVSRIDGLDVPETLHALIAARLDGLSPQERRLVQDAAVLGKTFTKRALGALGGLAEGAVEPLLHGLVRKELLSIQADPRSPERGQYGFLQDLVRRVAYETLARRDRKARHLAAAAYLEEAFGAAEQEVVEIVASHYVAAYDAAPDADDAAAIKARAWERLARAGERAASLGANEEAQRYFEQAAELAVEPLSEAELRERAGATAWSTGKGEEARVHFERALALYEAEGRTHPAARVTARLGEVDWLTGRIDEALERMERAFAVLASEEPDADVAALAAQLGRVHFFAGELERAAERIEWALEVAEALWLPEVLAEALTTAGLLASARGRPEQALALTTHAVGLALEHDLSKTALRALGNLGDQLDRRDRYEQALEQHQRGVALARKVGIRRQEWRLLAESAVCLFYLGRWVEALAAACALPEEQLPTGEYYQSATHARVQVAVARGEVGEARRLVGLIARQSEGDVQERSGFAVLEAVVLGAEGRAQEALLAARAALDVELRFGMQLGAVAKLAFVVALESTLAVGSHAEVEELLARIEGLPPGRLPPSLRAEAARFRARLAAARDDHDGVEPGFKAAAAIFREFGLPFPLAVTLVEHGEWLAGRGRGNEAEPRLAEAHEIFERLEARLWLGRVEQARGRELEPA